MRYDEGMSTTVRPPSAKDPAPTVGPSLGGAGLGAIVVAAYVAFGAFTLFHDGGASLIRVAAAADGDGGLEVGGERPVGGNLHLQFLCKFEEEQALAWRDRYLDDPAAAREAFERFADANPAFAGLRLERMNYSGEATLAFDGPAPLSLAEIEELSHTIVSRLSAAEGVEYAEPNLVGVREGEP